MDNVSITPKLDRPIGPLQATAVVAFSIAMSMLLLYATGCYRRDAILSRDQHT